MERIHIFQGQGSSNQHAEVTETFGGFFITNAWNCGQVTEEICFPTLQTARTYLAGKWNTPIKAIDRVGEKPYLRQLTVDEKIIKVVRQYAAGIVTEQEMQGQIDRIVYEEANAPITVTPAEFVERYTK